MSTTEALLKAIDAFRAETDMAESTFGLRALNDGTFVYRLRNGAGTTIKTADRVQAFIAAERAKMAAGARVDKRPSTRPRAA